MRTKGQSGDLIKIEISGTQGTLYDACWTVTGNSGEVHRFEDTGEVPASYTYTGDAIKGNVSVTSDSGRVELNIYKNGNRSRSATEGQGGTINFSVR